MDHYDTLGIAQDASAEQIKAAYRRLARRYHPDVSNETDAHDKIKAVNEAYGILGDEDKRRAYDRRLQRSDTGNIFEEGIFTGGLHDLFESLFSRGPERTTTYGLHLSLEQAYSGGVQQVLLDEQPLDIDIPAGIDEGERVRARGRSSLQFVIHYKPHPLFHVDKGHVLGALNVPVWKMALGGKHTVSTLGGPVEADLPVGLQPGQRIRLAGRGMPRRGHRNAGDHWAVVAPEVPAPTDAAQRKAYETLRDSFEKKKSRVTRK